MRKLLIVLFAVLSIAASAKTKSDRYDDGTLGAKLKFLYDTEYGKSPLIGINYNGAEGANSDYLATKTSDTHHFGLEFCRIVFPTTTNFTFFTGVRMDRYEYFFKNNYTFEYTNGSIKPIELNANVMPRYKSSELRTTYYGIPVGFNYKLGKKCSAEFFAFGGILGKSVNIVRSPKEKTENPGGLNDFQFGLNASVQRKHLGLFVKYIPTSVFKEDAGPQAKTLSFGLLIR